jgi:hypothetical protein
MKKNFKLGKIIAIFNPKLLIKLAIDTLDYVIDIEVGKIGKDKKYRLISFFLKKFLRIELNYKIYNKYYRVLSRGEITCSRTSMWL